MERKVKAKEIELKRKNEDQLKREIEIDLANHMVFSVCDRGIDVKQLEEEFPMSSIFYKDFALMKIILDGVSRKRYTLSLPGLGQRKTSCMDVHLDKITFLTGNQYQLILQLLDSLIIYNSDNLNSRVIIFIREKIPRKEIIWAIIRATEVLNELKNEALQLTYTGGEQELTISDARKGIINSLLPLLGDGEYEDLPEMYADLLIETHQMDPIAAETLEKQVRLLGIKELDDVADELFEK
jgi:hypothetical protein